MREFSKIKLGKIWPKNGLSIAVPASKNQSVLAIIFASIAEGRSVVRQILESDDVREAINAVTSLGVRVGRVTEGLAIEGIGIKNLPKKAEIYLGGSGTLTRCMLAVLAAVEGGEYTLSASDQMSAIPIDTLVDTLSELGMRALYVKENGHFPIKIFTYGIAGGSVRVNGDDASAFLNAFLIGSSLAKGPLELKFKDININNTYVQNTLQSMGIFGKTSCRPAAIEDGTIRMNPCSYAPVNIQVEADMHTAMYVISIGFLANMDLTINNINVNTFQPAMGFLDVLGKLGAKIETAKGLISIFKRSDREEVIGGFSIDMHDMSEMVTALACLGVYCNRPISIVNVRHAKTHELNRISRTVQELRRLSVVVEELEDGMVIYPSTPIFNDPINTYNDHRMTMGFSVFSAKNDIILTDPASVNRSCPSFFDIIGKIGVRNSLIR